MKRKKHPATKLAEERNIGILEARRLWRKRNTSYLVGQTLKATDYTGSGATCASPVVVKEATA